MRERATVRSLRKAEGRVRVWSGYEKEFRRIENPALRERSPPAVTGVAGAPSMN
jgi:hypothetical protein